eukprot:12687370-Alexandrium_andersonii.AAC.1
MLPAPRGLSPPLHRSTHSQQSTRVADRIGFPADGSPCAGLHRGFAGELLAPAPAPALSLIHI